MVFTLVKLNDGFMVGKPNTWRPSLKNGNSLAIADHIKTTGHNIKWDHFDVLAKGKTDYHCKSKIPYLFKNLNQLSMSTSELKSSCFINLL